MFGCAKKEAPRGAIVTGKVTLEGSALTGVGLRLYNPKQGLNLVCNLDENGEFKTHRPLPPGFYVVSITGGQGAGASASPVPPDHIPKHYWEGQTSDLGANVSVASSHFEFELNSGPRKSKMAKPDGPVVAPMIKPTS
jgi:hypothetical protein